MAEVIPSQRLVPGAPPPPALSKSQKKKRKSVITKAKEDDVPVVAIPNTTVSALIETVPDVSDIKIGVVAEELVATLEPIPETETVSDKAKKASPVVELINKRIKAQNKKLSRIAVYSSKPAAELNEDQKKSVATLPAIQGAVKELEESKKAIESLEADESKEKQRRQIEEERTVDDRIAQVISDTTAIYCQKISALLALIRLSGGLSTSDPTTFSISLSDGERQAIYSLTETLTSFEDPRKEDTIIGILRNEGEFDGVNYERILSIVESYRNPVVEPIQIPDESVYQPEELQPQIDEVVISESIVEESNAVADPLVPGNSSGSFHFMQESELEATSFEHDAEFIEKPIVMDPVVVLEVAETAGPSVIDTGIPLGVNGVHHFEEPPMSAGLDWAADDGEGLPSINSLHAKFGTSGAATPEASSQDAVPVDDVANIAAPPSVPVNDVDSYQDTAPASPQIDDDGFVKAKSGRGRQSEARPDYRGRGRGGFKNDRGGGGGEHRGGGFRGRGGGDFGANWRGGDGEFRGRGGFRGDRGRGDFRGGEFRGRGARGGDFRGRARGDRGGHRGGRGGFESSGDATPAS